jgi:hypothetical protein
MLTIDQAISIVELSLEAQKKGKWFFKEEDLILYQLDNCDPIVKSIYVKGTEDQITLYAKFKNRLAKKIKAVPGNEEVIYLPVELLHLWNTDMSYKYFVKSILEDIKCKNNQKVKE